MKTVFFSSCDGVIAVQHQQQFTANDVDKLTWLLRAEQMSETELSGTFVGPRKEVITPWSTNASEICGNVGVEGIVRIECFSQVPEGQMPSFDPMLQALYQNLSQETLVIDTVPEPMREVDNLAAYNDEAGLALSAEEIEFLETASEKLGRKFTDCEIYGFSQINSEHCRHKIFNGEFVIDGDVQPKSLFGLIKDTSKASPDQLVSAYKDNVAFIRGPKMLQFAPQNPDRPDYVGVEEIESVLSIKAETHNFPTTVEPFYGASTGSGGEIRDRMAGGTGSIPLGGTAVYMTAYPRLKGSVAVDWEKHSKPRDWKYQTPSQILIKASNGASDFGNKYGQPLIVGSALTYEGNTPRGMFGYDRTIMLAGGVGYARAEYALKQEPQVGDVLVLLGGENYRIGMAGGSVSSVDSGQLAKELELSAVQRANPEMQKRAYNVVRALSEHSNNPIRMIHDHGAGGHINCFSELLEEKGGRVDVSKLPLGDPTLSLKELICNESQERMGLLVHADDVPLLQRIAERERAPLYVVGEITGDENIVFQTDSGERPFDLPVEVLFGSSPKTILEDESERMESPPLEYAINDGKDLLESLKRVLSLEGVACKDWLTNKVDRCVTGLAAVQQCVGPYQLPLNNLGVMALDFTGGPGVATALGQAPIAGLLDARKGSVLSVAEALTNIVWAPLEDGLDSVVLSANWMWPAKQPGENARLYHAVEAISQFCIELGISIPTGKDSMSMTMNYADGKRVRAPGTVVVTAAGSCSDVTACVTPDLKPSQGSALLHIDLSCQREMPLGGSSFAQSLAALGETAADVVDTERFRAGFNYLQDLIKAGTLLAGHDISSGGLITAACEMAFTGDVGVELRIAGGASDVVPTLFSEKPGVLIQVEARDKQAILEKCKELRLPAASIGEVKGTQIRVHAGPQSFSASVAELRRVWFKPSFLLDSKQTKPALAKERYETFDQHPLTYRFPEKFSGSLTELDIDLRRTSSTGIRAAVVRDKGTNGDREMELCLFAAGFDVKDVTTTDLMSGRETLEDVNFLVFPGGFSNSDVLGAGRGWAGVFRYNENARRSLENFLAREDTLSLGVCNGCQLMVALDLVCPEHQKKMEMQHNESGKFESAFVNVRVQETENILLKPLVGSQLGIWVAHGEGRFSLPEGEAAYDIPLKYVSADYPANPNGADFQAAAVSSNDGRHLAIMPHLERSMFSWNWPYRADLPKFEVSPWILAFRAARDWVSEKS